MKRVKIYGGLNLDTAFVLDETNSILKPDSIEIVITPKNLKAKLTFLSNWKSTPEIIDVIVDELCLERKEYQKE